MTARFLLIVFEDLSQRDAFISDHSVPDDFAILFTSERVLAYGNADCRFLRFPGGRGGIIGDVFDRYHPCGAVSDLDERACEIILDSEGAQLLSSYWGGYVAAICQPTFVKIFRDPSGALPCYRVTTDKLTAFSSDIACLQTSRIADLRVDWKGLAHYLYASGLPTEQTAIEGISELLPGTAAKLTASHHCVEGCWSPWDYVVPDPEVDAADNAALLQLAVRDCVAAWARCFESILLSVSGGVDSSIVAASLASVGADFLCLTMFTDDPAGDERRFARHLCDRLGVELVERRFDVIDIDICQANGAGLPRPVGRTQSLAYEHALLKLACERAADAFFTGNGGDNVFAFSHSAAAILDRYRYEGFGRGVIGTLNDVQKLTGCSVSQALRAALKVAGAPSPAYQWRPDTLYLHPDVIAEQAGIGLSHSWLNAPKSALPGKAAHIAGLLRVQQTLVPMRSGYAPVVNPLLSQPIIERCLRIPSWQWCAGGMDRAIARRAFAPLLPQEIVTRTSKGTPDSFSVQVMDHFRPAIAERLLDGHLARHRLIDRRALEMTLFDQRPNMGLEHVRLLDLLDTEAWIDEWSAQGFTPSFANRASDHSPRRLSQ